MSIAIIIVNIYHYYTMRNTTLEEALTPEGSRRESLQVKATLRNIPVKWYAQKS